ncbi:pectate lyase 1 [Aristolochia californica]|uniref:pectate lyase 1 n=1 Tax=Aristolochia californica TaxID=171875 RepID=UPI0035D9A65F
MMNNIGRGTRHYIVTDPSDDPVHPRPGTLRFGATSIRGKVWISFRNNMAIKLQKPLLVSSFTVIDGRGAQIQIAYGSCLVLYEVNNVIIHGLSIHHCQKPAPGPVLSSKGVINMGALDGDAITLIGSSKIWIDHNSLYECHDGLLDVTRGSTDVTISNNRFMNHDKVMLLGHDDQFLLDKKMKVSILFNHFGPNVNQRIPRVRHGYAHVANNFYQGWGSYAIGGSMNPRIKSQSNLFVAPNSGKKEVTWRGGNGNGWNWRSVKDVFLNGARFSQTGVQGGTRPGYNRQQAFVVGDARNVRALTRSAGVLRCSSTGC